MVNTAKIQKKHSEQTWCPLIKNTCVGECCTRWDAETGFCSSFVQAKALDRLSECVFDGTNPNNSTFVISKEGE